MYLVVPQLQNRQIKTERATEISTLEKVSEIVQRTWTSKM